MTTIHLPTPGNADNATNLEAALGTLYVAPDGTEYRLVKAAATISNAECLVLQIGVTSGGKLNWTVNLPSADDNTQRCVVVPDGQKGSTGTGALQNGDYFLAIVRGPARFVANAAISTGATAILRPKTNGRVEATTTAQNVGSLMIPTQAAASAGDKLHGYVSSSV